jgi:hypothetical protein
MGNNMSIESRGLLSGNDGGRFLTLNTAGATTAEWRGGGEADVRLRVHADHEGGNVNDLRTNDDVALLDENTGMVDGTSHLAVEDDGLETAVQEILELEGEDEVELVLVLGEDADAVQAPEEGLALEDAAGVVLGKSHELSGNLAALGEGEANAPDLLLAAETVLTANLKLSGETLLLERTAGSAAGLRAAPITRNLRHGSKRSVRRRKEIVAVPEKYFIDCDDCPQFSLPLIRLAIRVSRFTPCARGGDYGRVLCLLFEAEVER